MNLFNTEVKKEDLEKINQLVKKEGDRKDCYDLLRVNGYSIGGAFWFIIDKNLFTKDWDFLDEVGSRSFHSITKETAASVSYTKREKAKLIYNLTTPNIPFMTIGNILGISDTSARNYIFKKAPAKKEKVKKEKPKNVNGLYVVIPKYFNPVTDGRGATI